MVSPVGCWPVTSISSKKTKSGSPKQTVTSVRVGRDESVAYRTAPASVSGRTRPILLKNSLRLLGGKIVARWKARNLLDSRE
jgi:hypothetical protein